ncbi:hypothetical protein [Micromonospora sp. WMMD714]|uniref:hypothetical protein n=1 Tax=Micromonospora sp. WMMD714 TaxID=3016097 RepID=UPI00249B928A|nr:hypothetical protein [Micromonospora sp. WMMD714]WFE62760.1 hypothetical protein O7625_05390 [Micromonospora sp. WMMD714]
MHDRPRRSLRRPTVVPTPFRPALPVLPLPPGLPLPPVLLALPVLLVLLTGCTADGPSAPPTAPVSDPAPAPGDTAREELAALAAAARDRHLTARYTLSGTGGPTRDITVTSANDGSWRVDVPGGALGGTADIALAATPAGLFQCALPSAGRPDPATCARLGDRDDAVPRRVDPRVQHPFTDWLAVLTDRRTALSVSAATAPAGVPGRCYAVESTAASLTPPLDVGIYCFAPDGTLTFVRAALGTLTLAGPPGPAPDTVPLAGPVVAGEPLGQQAAAVPSPGTS